MNTIATVTITAVFPVSGSFLNSTRTLSKSMGFGLTNRLPPNEVKWLQEQLINPFNVADKTCKYKDISVGIFYHSEFSHFKAPKSHRLSGPSASS